ncbi:MAG: U32 family peptidase, partial [Spirochaetota bacterium]|nr:U32 family peptidase [Spirochaetota bacterium]
MELLAPAGNIEKLYYAYKYGADAAYIGIKNFSLRAKADNFKGDDWGKISKVKGDKKLFGALNIFFHNEDLRTLEENIDYLKLYPFDAFII